MDKKEIISRIVEKIKAGYKPQKIIIFGSYAWGKPTKGSDVDLLVVKETLEKPRERTTKVRRILSEENAILGMDILVYTPDELSKRLKIEDSFLSKILKKGKVMYG